MSLIPISRRIPESGLYELLTSESFDKILHHFHLSTRRDRYEGWSLQWLKPHGSPLNEDEDYATITFPKEFWPSPPHPIITLKAPAHGYLCYYTENGQKIWYGGGHGGDMVNGSIGIGALLDHPQSSEVFCIYDTSFLMNKDLDSDPYAAWLETHPELHAAPERVACEIRRIIPVQVKRELHSHFNNPEKSPKARAARNLLATILAEPNAQECDLQHEEAFPLIERDLGPDSDVDKQLLYFALNRARTGRGCFVATDDGGIRMEIIQQRKRNRMPIFCQSNLKEFFMFLNNQLTWDKWKTRLS